MTRDLAEWKGEIAWMSLYFSAAVWASLALCVCYSLEGRLPHYRTEATVVSLPSDAPAVAGKLQRASGVADQLRRPAMDPIHPL